ncbi:DUF2341 domain-containing protein, partial [bacterium]|nr:DUF2341 domain-containing protein [bacterium]
LMKTDTPFFKSVLRIIIILYSVFVTSHSITAQSWYDAGWLYRSQVDIPNIGASTLTDFQVRINLNVGNFDFTKSLNDGSDIRVTASDGTTLIPFWIETWTSSNASVWIKVPNIPVGGTTVYLYFGNVAPTLPPAGAPVETPPIGPFTRAVANPIQPIGDPALGNYLLAENIIYDAVSGHYWLVFANYRDISIGLAWSDTPTDPTSWHVLLDGENVSQVIPLANAPHLMEYNGTYYIFFADRLGFPGNTGPYSISYATASSIEGPYTRFGSVLDPTPDSWETHRVDEPYVFQHTDGTWYMVYMADSGDDVEQIGYATAPSITGPYTKYSGNPVLAFGDSYDHGTIADPWIYNYHGVFYIGYTVSGNGQWPWNTALATTSDWINFEKHGIILPLAESGWDATNSFRGALIRIADTYVFSYTGGSYQMGIATQPVYMSPTIPINDPDAVFDFYDGFDGISLNTSKWTVMNGEMESAILNGGVLSLESGAFKTRIFGNTSFGPNTIFEGRAQHPDHGNAGRIMQLGFVDYEFLYPTRFLDDDNDLTHWLRHANYPG